MLYLNTRHQLPTIATRSQYTRVSRAHVNPAEIHTNPEMPRADHQKQRSTLQIDSYPSRHAYGARKVADICLEASQKAYQDIAKTTSKHTQEAWAVIDGGGKPGQDYQVQKATSDFWSQVKKQRYIEIQAIPDPNISYDPGSVRTNIIPANMNLRINTTKEGADIRVTPGNFEIYMKDKGYLNRWTSEGKYDIYA